MSPRHLSRSASMQVTLGNIKVHFKIKSFANCQQSYPKTSSDEERRLVAVFCTPWEENDGPGDLQSGCLENSPYPREQIHPGQKQPAHYIIH